MILHRFHTFRTDYYFPSPVKGGAFLFGLYHPYNQNPIRLAAIRLYWWLFRHCSLVRRRFAVENADDEFSYTQIMRLCPKGSVVSFNMGTPGPEQKISMLGMKPNGTHFFAKYSTKPAAMALSRNEIKVLKELKGKGLAPELKESVDSESFVFFITSCVDGVNPKNVALDNNILSLTECISSINVKSGNLVTCLSHGDFTPWNIIIDGDGEYRLIDWEMAAERELGYDLFTYITHVGALLSPDTAMMQMIEDNKLYVDRYFANFGINDWMPYLKAYGKRRIEYETSKGNIKQAEKYECLL